MPGQGCAAAAPGAPQLLVTNLAVASALLSAFWAWRESALDYEEAWVDVRIGRAVPIQRKPARPARSEAQPSLVPGT